MILSLIIIHVGLFLFYVKIYKEVRDVKRDYEEDRAEVKVNGALFEGEEKFTKEEITRVMSNYVNFKELLDERDKRTSEINRYIVQATQRLESRPEEIRKELLKEVKTLTAQHRELLAQLQIVDRKITQETNILFQDIQSVKATIDRNTETKRSY